MSVAVSGVYVCLLSVPGCLSAIGVFVCQLCVFVFQVRVSVAGFLSLQCITT